MPWIRYPFSAAVIFMPFLWPVVIIVSLLWLSSYWLGLSIIATFVVWWRVLGEGTWTYREGLSFDVQPTTWIAILVLVINWVLLVLWCTRHSRKERREQRNWSYAAPDGHYYEQDQPQGELEQRAAYEAQFEQDVAYWQRVQEEAARRSQLERARQPRFE
ncbi:hypothetical protein C5E05_05775 [Pseudoclavibacter sp. AY1H1]|nr:hypothetical protein C5E05_05775 [Pseudoclavibacter sp. AY1H1]